MIKCPIEKDFFIKMKTAEREQVKREVVRSWELEAGRAKHVLRRRLQKSAAIKVHREKTQEWCDAFRYSEAWNQYKGFSHDRAQFEQEIREKMWVLEKGTIEIDLDVWLTLASLAYLHEQKNQSPNHFFLKELFHLYIDRFHPGWEIQMEYPLSIYGEPVVCDAACVSVHTGEIALVGEMGGVQLWKAMALLHAGYEIIVFPHWTRNKTNPFIRRRFKFHYYWFSREPTEKTDQMVL